MRVLVVEDEPTLGRQLVAALQDSGYAVDWAKDGEEAQFLGETEPFDAVVLDLGLPKIDGISVLRHWRRTQRTMPVLILTARDSWRDKVEGLDSGADDYLAKPFRLEELQARLRSLIRRSSGKVSSAIECGPIRLDTRTNAVTVEERPVPLTAHEYRVLSYLIHHQGRAISRTELTEHIYAQDFDRDSNTIEVFVARLRRKLGVDCIHTVRGFGYQMDAPT